MTTAVKRSSQPTAKPVAAGEVVYAYVPDNDLLQAVAGKRLAKGERLAVITTQPPSGGGSRRQRKVLFRGIIREPAVEEPRNLIARQAFQPDARSRAILRGVKMAEEDLRASGGAYDLAEVQSLMHGISRQAIDKKVREGSLLAVPGPGNRRSYPTAQFLDDGSVIGGLKELRDVLPTKSPWAILNFLVNPEPRLNGRKPIELLRSGDVETVLDAARRVGIQGA